AAAGGLGRLVADPGAGDRLVVRRFDPRGELQRRALCPAARARDGRLDRAGRRRARGPRGAKRERRARGPQVQARLPRERLGARVAALGTPRTLLRRGARSRRRSASARASSPGGRGPLRHMEGGAEAGAVRRSGHVAASLVWLFVLLGVAWGFAALAPGRTGAAAEVLERAPALSLGLAALVCALIVPSLIALCLVV